MSRSLSSLLVSDVASGHDNADFMTPEQCEVIHIEWGRQSAIGYGSVVCGVFLLKQFARKNPVAPYSLVVYTS